MHLTLGNTFVNSALSIVITDLVDDGLVGFTVSTFLLMLIGEIIPQAVVSRFALRIGSALIPLVNCVMFLCLPMTYPIAFCLDKLLGEVLGIVYDKKGVKKLVDLNRGVSVKTPSIFWIGCRRSRNYGGSIGIFGEDSRSSNDASR